MTVPTISAVQLGGDRAHPLLVLGPSLGTSVRALWDGAAHRLADTFHVVGWDLPGHGDSPPADDGFTIAELAEGVLALVGTVLVERGDADGSFAYAGVSVGGAVGLQVLLDHPGRIDSATLLCAGARIGSPESWGERAELVRRAGTSAVVTASAERWFASGFVERRPDIARDLLTSLRAADAASYAWVCEALAGFDVRERLGSVTVPVLAVAGEADVVAPVSSLRELADGVRHGRLAVLDDVAHLASAESPDEVARLVVGWVRLTRTSGEIYDVGMTIRREVLGDAHVDRATAEADDLTRDFQELITQYAWGSIWGRPGLDRRSRSIVTLTALVARGHHDELALHLRAARTNGLSNADIKEVLLQTAIYCGVPDANTAFRISQRVLAEVDAERETGPEQRSP